MSAPPIGTISVMPKMKDRIRDGPEGPGRLHDDESSPQGQRSGSAIRRLRRMARRQENWRTRHVSRSVWRKAMIEPAKGDGADGDTQAHLDQALCLDDSRAHIGGVVNTDAISVRAKYSAAPATSTAARPTSEWKAATNCGMAVIAMRFAVTAPIAPPIPRPPRTKTHVQNIVDLPSPRAS